MDSPAEMAAVLRRAAARVVPGLEEAVAETMQYAHQGAQATIGQGRPEWPPFAESTVNRADWVGPLERTGDLRSSLHVRTRGLTGYLYSTEDYIVYSELGTSHEPPRPFLKESVREAMETVGIRRMRFVLTTLLGDFL